MNCHCESFDEELGSRVYGEVAGTSRFEEFSLSVCLEDQRGSSQATPTPEVKVKHWQTTVPTAKRPRRVPDQRTMSLRMGIALEH